MSSETFLCATHSIEVQAGGRGCERCQQDWEQRRSAAEMTPDERAAEMERWGRQISIPMGQIHQRITELVGRDVWTHEIGLCWDQLVEEARHPSGVVDIDQVIARAELSGKPVVVVTMPEKDEDR